LFNHPIKGGEKITWSSDNHLIEVKYVIATIF